MQNGVVSRLGPPGLLVDTDEQWEVDDPDVAIRALMDRRPAEIVAQLAEHLTRGEPLVGDDQQQVSRLGGEPIGHGGLLVDRQELGDGRLERAVGCDLEPHEALGAEALRPVGELVELVAPVVAGGPCNADALDRAGTGECFELGGGEHVGELDKLHPETKVRLVDAVSGSARRAM